MGTIDVVGISCISEQVGSITLMSQAQTIQRPHFPVAERFPDHADRQALAIVHV